MYTRRHIAELCQKTLDDRKILVLIGARQTGKSTLARELLSPVTEGEKLILNLWSFSFACSWVRYSPRSSSSSPFCRRGPWRSTSRKSLEINDGR